MKKIIIFLTFCLLAIAGYSNDGDTTYTYKKVVINKDTVLVKTMSISMVVVDSIPKKENREYLDKINQSIKNNDESHAIHNAEYKRLDEFYKKEKARIKAELAK